MDAPGSIISEKINNTLGFEKSVLSEFGRKVYKTRLKKISATI